MKLFLLGIALMFSMIACNKEQKEQVKEVVVEKICDAGKAATAVVAVQVSNELSCKNVAAIKATLEAKVLEIKACEKPAQPVVGVAAKSVVGDLLCAPLINAIFAQGIAQFPKEWECTGDKLADTQKAKLIENCLKSL